MPRCDGRACVTPQVSVAVPGGGVPLQIDGEPYNVAAAGGGSEPFELSVQREGQALMLAAPVAGTPVKGNAFAAVEGQLKAKAIGTEQRDALLRALAS